MIFLQLSRLRVIQLGVVGASATSTMLQLFLPMEVSIPFNVLLLGLVFGLAYTYSERKPFTAFLLGGVVAINVISLFGLLQHGLEVFTLALLGSYSVVYLLPFITGLFTPIMVFFALYEVPGETRTLRPKPVRG
jgi:hypothetical protein